MVANESFLDTALLRDSVVSHAKTLGYTPHSRKSASASLTVTVPSQSGNTALLTIPKGYKFLSEQIDGKTYTFVTLQDVRVTKANNSYIFDDLIINEGQLISYTFVHSESSNPNQIFELPEENIDTQTISVSVSPSVSNTSIEIYDEIKDVTDVKSDSAIFYLQETRSGRYQIYFGDDIIGKSLADGAVVTVTYLVTSGADSNKANNFVATSPLQDSIGESLTNFTIVTNSKANGGSEKETVDSIKYNAPLQFASQNRLVTYRDYEVFIRNSYPNIDSISVWGGEDEVPPVYGKVFVSLKPKSDYYISETEKTRLIEDVIKPKSIVAVTTEFREPEFIFIHTISNVQYEPSKTTLTEDALKNAIRSSILLYKNVYLDRFNAKFAISKLQDSIDSVDLSAIVGSSVIVRVQKRFLPVINQSFNYTLNFNIPLVQGTTFNKLTSTEFTVFDSSSVKRKVTLEEVPKSFTGINSVEIVNPGSSYTSPPTVTITGDGFGATATATIKDGKIESIDITNPGIDYNRAVVTITGGGGFGASALAVIDTRIGKLRTVYYTASAERVVVNSNAGTINYQDGIIELNDLRIVENDTIDNLVRVECGIQESIVQSSRNTILTIDESDPSSIIVNLEKL
jgi:hypothetical protein